VRPKHSYSLIAVLTAASLVLGVAFRAGAHAADAAAPAGDAAKHFENYITIEKDALKTLVEKFSGARELDPEHEPGFKVKSRVHGYEGNKKAADFIIREFRRIGLSEITVDEVCVAAPVEKHASLTVTLPGGTRVLPLHCIWPNLVRTPTIPPGGLTAHSFYAGAGDFEDYDSNIVEGAVVFMEFNSQDNFIKARSLGAKAVIFIGRKDITTTEAEGKFSETPLDVPRFWIAESDFNVLKPVLEGAEKRTLPAFKTLRAEVAALHANIKAAEEAFFKFRETNRKKKGLVERKRKELATTIEVLQQKILKKKSALAAQRKYFPVTVKARMDWQNAPGRNIMGTIVGTDPVLNGEVVIIQSFYDSMSVVPAMSPGAEQACGIAALLKLAELFKAHPPKRTIVFLATTAHCYQGAGINEFIFKRLSTPEFRSRIGDETFAAKLGKRIDYRLFVGLDLSSGTGKLGMSANDWLLEHGGPPGYMFTLSDNTLYQRHAKPVMELLFDRQEIFENLIKTKRGTRRHQDYLPGPLVLDGAAVARVKGPGIALVTTYDIRQRVDIPFDFANRVNFDNLHTQVKFISAFLASVLNDQISIPKLTKLPKRVLVTAFKGRVVEFIKKRSFAPDTPVEDALVCFVTKADFLHRHRRSYGGVRGLRLFITDREGCFYRPHLYEFRGEIMAFKVDPDTGKIIYAADMGESGAKSNPLQIKLETNFQQNLTVVMFRCDPVEIHGITDARYYRFLSGVKLLDPADAEPQSFGYFVNPEPEPSEPENCGLIFLQPGGNAKFCFSRSVFGLQYLLLNIPRPGESPKGFTPSEDELILHAELRATRDMYNVDEERIELLRKYGVENKWLDTLHQRSQTLLRGAEAALDRRDYGDYMKTLREARACESTIYPDIRGAANDVVKGIIFYFALLIPFAFFAERLTFCCADIRARIAAIFGIFSAVFIVLRFVHPAFLISQSPYIIFLAFVIMALATTVLVIIIGKFNEQIAQMRRKASRIHETDVGRISASAAAFSLGISNLKKRKGRTAFTTITLILLTFTVLSFTSVQTSTRFNPVDIEAKPSYNGFMFRDRNWYPIPRDLVTSLYNKMKTVEVDGGRVDATIAYRSWFDRESVHLDMTRHLNMRLNVEGELYRLPPPKSKEKKKEKKKEKAEAICNGILGLSPAEVRVTGMNKYLLHGRWFEDDDENVCIVPAAMAELLGITAENFTTKKIEACGRKLQVIGIIDAVQGKKHGSLQSFRDIDDQAFTPPKPVTVAAGGGRAARTDIESVKVAAGEIREFEHTGFENCLLVPHETVMQIGGRVASIAFTYPVGTDFLAPLKNFMEYTRISVFVGDTQAQTCTAYSSIGISSLGGAADLFIPILIAALIVLNTMMGSVYERHTEIGIYSSVGLAPTHIAFLFIAEACVYAVMGAIMGYLAGQILAKVLTMYDLAEGLTLNYTSMSAVFSTLLVMATVLLSTIYPAKVASRMAVPDVTRKWKFPDPDGDRWLFDFPFTVATKSVRGIYAFLNNFFDSYREESVGSFYTDSMQFATRRNDYGTGYVISMKVWLAPYDSGVSQYVEFRALKTEDEGISRIELYIERLSGEIATWVRLNRNFLTEIRKQFLIWRTVPPHLKDEYDEEGKRLFGE